MITTRGRGRRPDRARGRRAASRPRWRGPSDGAVLDEQVALGDVLAGRAHVLAALGRLRDPDLWRRRGRSTRRARPRRRPSGTGAPVMILTAVPGDSASSAAWPAPISPTTGRCTGLLVAGAWRRRRCTHGVPVHRGVVEARQRDRRDDVLGARPARGRPAAAASYGGSGRDARRGSARGARRPDAAASVGAGPSQSAVEHRVGRDPLRRVGRRAPRRRRPARRGRTSSRRRRVATSPCAATARPRGSACRSRRPACSSRASSSTNGTSAGLVEHEVRAEVVDVGAQHQQVVGRLDRDEPVAADLDRAGALEHLDRGAHRGLDLDHLRASTGRPGSTVFTLRISGRPRMPSRRVERRRASRRRSNHRLLVEQNRCRSRSASAVRSSAQRLRGLAQHDPAVALAAGEVAALAVGRRAPDGLDRERRAATSRTSRRPGRRARRRGCRSWRRRRARSRARSAGRAGRCRAARCRGRRGRADTTRGRGPSGQLDRGEVLRRRSLGSLFCRNSSGSPSTGEVLVAGERGHRVVARCGSCS